MGRAGSKNKQTGIVKIRKSLTTNNTNTTNLPMGRGGKKKLKVNQSINVSASEDNSNIINNLEKSNESVNLFPKLGEKETLQVYHPEYLKMYDTASKAYKKMKDQILERKFELAVLKFNYNHREEFKARLSEKIKNPNGLEKMILDEIKNIS